ncbi:MULTISPECIES: hypothetical protein [unclassified Streptomyces]|uniref:hypothetical protein n=1 Tax=unclassified Streptomyces TaxID=2593676 RepID=UPI0022590203|nr:MULTISPECIES: hypothetical protein [unclassified Streptomyces]MCX4525362.1 hypothetical protein [Streptomyces sp. NBC_01551]MCX4544166.1 hypothetical protein [Streptomyces sp. NBC_01565]
MSMLLRNLLVLAVESGAAYLLRSPDPAPWIPVLLAVFVVGSGVLHGTDAEFVPRFLVAFAAVGVAWLGAMAWDATDSVPAAGVVALLVIQTGTLIRHSRGG